MKGPLAGVSKTVYCVAATGVTPINDATALISTRYDDGVTYDGDTGELVAISDGVYALSINAMQTAAFSSDDSTPVWDGTALSILMQMPADVGGEGAMAPLTTLFIPTGTDFDDFRKIGITGSVMSGLAEGSNLKMYLKHDATESFPFVVNFSFIKVTDSPTDLS